MSQLEAVIEIGSTGIRLAVAQIDDDGSWRFIDKAELPVALGWDVFTTHLITRETLIQCLRILTEYKAKLAEYALDKDHVSIIATSALREARNRDAILDRIRIKTGLDVTIINGIEENRLMYIAAHHAIKNNRARLEQFNSIIIDVGGGSTEIMLLNKGQMVAAHSLRLGTVIIEQHIKSIMGNEKDAVRFMEEYVNNVGGTLSKELTLSKIQQFIAIGQEAYIAAEYIGKQIGEHCYLIARESFNAFVQELQTYSIEECVSRFKIPYAEARTMTTNLLTYNLCLNLTAAKEVLVIQTSIREGIIVSKYTPTDAELQQNFLSQVTASARNLCRKYRIDEKHAEYVRAMTLKLSDQLQDEHGFTSKERILLEVAALLHDVGTFIHNTKHEEHSAYIIMHSEIFGLSKEEMIIVSNVARYHKGAPPSVLDSRFYALNSKERITVQKMAAILRIADALDRGHTQRLSNISVHVKNDAVYLACTDNIDTTLEKNAIAEKADLFEQIFGYRVILC